MKFKMLCACFPGWENLSQKCCPPKSNQTGKTIAIVRYEVKEGTYNQSKANNHKN